MPQYAPTGSDVHSVASAHGHALKLDTRLAFKPSVLDFAETTAFCAGHKPLRSCVIPGHADALVGGQITRLPDRALFAG